MRISNFGKINLDLEVPDNKGQTMVEKVGDSEDVNSLYLNKSYENTEKSPRTPFGPKTNACIIPAKNFDNAEIELDSLEGYHIWSDIGRGTYAVVKFATVKATREKVAIKIYEKSKIQEPIRQKSVKTEISLLKQLRHPNIVQLIEEVSGEKNLYLVMEYVQGTSLQGFIVKKPWKRVEEHEAAGMFVQIMEALNYCHSKNISHRDIKLENILLDVNLQIKIIDFGFARMAAPDKKSYIYCGTPNYMAPEIIQKVQYAGPPVDIWAAGVVLYVMLTGGFPFSSMKETKVFKKILSGNINFPDFLTPICKNLILLMFTQDPDSRITASQVLDHPWVKFKGNYTIHNTPLRGDCIEVDIEDDITE